jgi:hypothetical protein
VKTFFVFSLSHHGKAATPSALIAAAVLTLSPMLAYGGKLEETRSAVRGDGSSSTQKNASSDNDDDDSDDSDDSSDHSDSSAVLYCLIPIVLPFCLIVAAASDENENSTSLDGAHFLPYPYVKGRPGRLVVDEEIETRPAMLDTSENEEEGQVLVLSDTPYEPEESASSAGGGLWADYYYDLDKIHVAGVSFLLDTASRMGFETNWRLFLEPLPNEVDKLVLGRLHFNLRFLQSRYAEGRLGLGGRLMVDDRGVEGGFSSAFTFAVFPVQPLILTADMSIGNLSRALFLEGQLTVGAAIRRLELFAGYRGTYIHGSDVTVVFHGPAAGIALWF